MSTIKEILMFCLIFIFMVSGITACAAFDDKGQDNGGEDPHESATVMEPAGSQERVEAEREYEVDDIPGNDVGNTILVEPGHNPNDRMLRDRKDGIHGHDPDNSQPVGDREPVKHLPQKLSQPKIIVKKAERLLELWDEEELYDAYPIALGFNPVGHKKREGDGRTPEGNYYVCTRNDKSLYYKSLGVSYPNKEDAKAALEEEAIEAATYESIAERIDTDGQPPWKTPMGGEIMIHGHGSHGDWTLGCVAVDDDVMDILWQLCPLKTPIIIEP
ncbi:MAG: L,D-transpeptidase family protein [Clostridiales bacterium]|nr:L,D-transpeptidase family protein [Clostridiales bacterium]